MISKVAISMIVLMYDGEQYLDRIIRMYKENRVNFSKEYPQLITELILVNDYPGTTLEVSDVLISDNDIGIVQNEQNLGIQRSKIEGLRYSKGEYVFFLDQDDLISSDYFVVQYNIIRGYDACICNLFFDGAPFYYKNEIQALDLDFYFTGYNAIISLGQILLRREAIPLEWIDHPLEKNGADDYYLVLIMLLKKQPMVEHRNILYHHTFTGENYSSNYSNITESVFELFDKLLYLHMITESQNQVVRENRNAEKREIALAEQKYSEGIKKQLEGKRRLIKIYEECLINLERGLKFDSCLKAYNIQRLAVYGAGKMGKHFKFWMQSSDVEIKFFIDKNVEGNINDIPVLSMDNALIKEKSIDAIVVTPMKGTTDIISDLKEKFDCIIISLEEVIYNMPCQMLEFQDRKTEKIYTNIKII